MTSYMQELEGLDKQEEALYSTLRSWRAAIGRSEWFNVNSVWRYSGMGVGCSIQEMSESEEAFEKQIFDTLDYIKSQKVKILNRYLENLQ